MAWLEKRSGIYRITFRYSGQKWHHSLKTDNTREAQSCLSRLEENLRLLERGRIELPPSANLPVYLLSDGKVESKPVAERPLTLKELFNRYADKSADGVKEANTRYIEQIHVNHLTRLIGARVPLPSVTTALLQKYVDDRGTEIGRKGRPLSHATVRKEIGTFASIWNKWALPRGLVKGQAPTRGLIYRKSKGKPPFQTWKQIEHQIARGGLDEGQEDELWNSLFLTLPEVEALLDFVKDNRRHQFVYVMFAIAAHTGARRSEILRSRVDDFDFAAGMMMVREKKRDKTAELTFRQVPMSAFLQRVMQDWFKVHPGGQLTICETPNEPLSVQLAAHHFRWTVDGSKWEKLRGWHALRHSFASNCAAKGIDQRMIDEWMGHQTEQMRKRYRHLIPSIQAEAIKSVFGH